MSLRVKKENLIVFPQQIQDPRVLS